MRLKDQVFKAVLEDGIPEQRLAEALRILKGEEGGSIKTSTLKRGFLGTKEAMEYLGGICRANLWRAVKKGLPVHRFGGKNLYMADEIDEFVRSKDREGITEKAS